MRFAWIGMHAEGLPAFEALLAARFVQGFGSAGLINLAVVLISDHFEGIERTHWIGRNSSALILALALFPVLSGLITDAFGWRWALAPYGLSLITAVVAWRMLESDVPRDTLRIGQQLGGIGQAIRNPVLATMMMMAFIVVGLFSYQRLPVDQFPDITFPVVVVQTEYPGAAPESVESDVTRKVEEIVNTISGIDEIFSHSYQGTSVVVIKFDLSVDVGQAAQDVRDKIALIRPQFRNEVKDPRVGLVTITSTEVSKDLSHATVYFTPFAGTGDAAAALEALQHAAGYLRHQVRNQMRLRVAPDLVFRIDDSVERGARLSALIHDAVESDKRRHVEPDPDPE